MPVCRTHIMAHDGHSTRPVQRRSLRCSQSVSRKESHLVSPVSHSDVPALPSKYDNSIKRAGSQKKDPPGRLPRPFGLAMTFFKRIRLARNDPIEPACAIRQYCRTHPTRCRSERSPQGEVEESDRSGHCEPAEGRRGNLPPTVAPILARGRKEKGIRPSGYQVIRGAPSLTMYD